MADIIAERVSHSGTTPALGLPEGPRQPPVPRAPGAAGLALDREEDVASLGAASTGRAVASNTPGWPLGRNAAVPKALRHSTVSSAPVNPATPHADTPGEPGIGFVYPSCELNRTLSLTSPRMRGDDVTELQERLRLLGFFRGPVDGVFGPRTAKALMDLERSKGLRPTGTLRPDSWFIMATDEQKRRSGVWDPDPKSPALHPGGGEDRTKAAVEPGRTVSQTAVPRPPLPKPEPAAVRIVVDVTKLSLTVYVQGQPQKTYPIAIGRWHTPTPVGEFTIVEKAYSPGGAFGSRWMGLNVPWGGYGIHGTNVPWSIGSHASAGCIRMFNQDVEQVFALVPMGTRVEIVGYEPEPTILRPPIRKGHTGKDVQFVQHLLRRALYDPGPADGWFGSDLEEALKELQILYGLPVTGTVTYNEAYVLGLQ
ncbi:MAG: peptidoglycan-binding protein [Firmicutes bacterium]|nr:peptidoglycan-binding protein [Bacillota bacterium]